MKKALKITRKVLFWIFFVCLFLTTVATVILHVYEDDIKRYALHALNEQLTTDVEVQEIELSIFHDFPNASVQFKQVFIADAFPGMVSEDTLFYAGEMFFNFNVMNIYSGNYEVNRVSVHDGLLDLKTLADGQTNYDILKDTDEQDTEEDFALMLNLLDLEDFEFRYGNEAAKQFYDLDLHKGLVQGDFTAAEYNLIAESDLTINRLISNSFSLVSDKEARLDLELSVNSETQSYVFNKGLLNIEEMAFTVNGMFDSSSVDLLVAGDQIEIHDLLNSTIDQSVDQIKKYEGKGEVTFSSHIHGPVDPTKMPAIEASFEVSGASVTEPESNLTITDVKFSGNYENAQDNRQEMLVLKDIHLRMLDSYFKGDASVVDFTAPLVSANMDGNLDLGKVRQFFNPEKVEKLAGNLTLNCSTVVQFHDDRNNNKKFDIVKSDGRFLLTDVKYKSRDSDVFYQNITGELVVNKNDAVANDLKIKTAKSDVFINGAVKNVAGYLEGTGNLGLTARLHSQRLVLDEFISQNSGGGNSSEVFELPGNIDMNVDMNVAQFTWDNHMFEAVSTQLRMAKSHARMANLSCRVLGGEVKGELELINLLTKGNEINGDLNFNGVNVNDLFRDWDNFNQKSITHQHLSGTASGDVKLHLSFNPAFTLLEDRLFTDCNVKITQGELNDLASMKSITDYMRSNKALKLMLNKHIDAFEDKLLHLKFSDIENHITIQNRKVNIPKMLIKTNAIDIELFGWHDFDNQMEYHFSFRFRELKQQVSENEFGIIEDDGLGLVVYLTMYGDIDEPEFSLDGQERRNQVKQQMAQEKQDVKSILKTELGLFRKDSTVKTFEQDNGNHIEVIVEDDNAQEGQSDRNEALTEDKKKKKHKSGILQKWKEDADQSNTGIRYEEEDK